MVQANIGSIMKIGAERGAVQSFKTVLNRYKQLSLRPAAVPLDLIIWPETAYPETLYSNLLVNDKLTPPLIKQIIQTHQAPLLIGGYDLTMANHKGGDFNTVFLFNQNSVLATTYHKIKLIPFGEGLPFGPLNSFLKKWITNISYFSAGSRYSLFSLKRFHFITPVCYEILFPRFIRNYLNNLSTHPNFIVNLTNDSWYGDTSEPLQHLFLAKWRALEFQLPLIRMTNTGISSIIYPDGHESQRLGVYQQDIIDLPLLLSDNQPTFFQRYGIYPLLLLITIIGLGLFFMAKRGRD
jgi:apolipoprotein N-acyltransferase